MYTVTWGRYVESDEEVEAYWKELVTEHFNNDDVTAREAMEQLYAEEGGWSKERLHQPDLIITEWRKLASAHNRGIQRFT